MQTTLHRTLSLSRLMLGTVQFGMQYGIANTSGQPSYESARDIIACAVDGGVTCLDTAAEYGESEAVIGKALTELGLADEVTVITKIRHLQRYQSTVDAERAIEESIVTSLKQLRLESLPICLFHIEEDFRHIDFALKLKERGLVRHLGSSVMTPQAASAIVESGLAEAIQIPINMLDQRFTRQGVCTAAKSRDVAIFGRSVYLQGLFLMPEEKILPQLQEVIPVRRALERLARDAGMPMAELAVRYNLGIESLTSVLVGVETVGQMRENLALFNKGPLDPALMQAVEKAVPPMPDRILMPNRWHAPA